MYNPTEGFGLEDCFVIINDKVAKNECLTVVILYVFLREAERLGMTCSGIKLGGTRRACVSFNSDLNLPWLIG